METLCCPSEFRVLIGQNCYNPNSSYFLSNSINGYSSKTKFKLQKSSHRIYRSYAVHSHVSDFAVAENPNCRESFTPLPDTTPNLESQSDHLWGALEIAEAVGGKIVQWGPSGTISTNTMKLMPRQWFFALKGSNFDGHDFIDTSLAIDKGCIGVVGNKVCNNWPNGFVKVEGDTMVALEKMAQYARNRFCGLVIGLTGSVGKTTTRTMITLALESLGRAYQTQGNFNYMVGVALTLAGIPLDAATAVVELGMGGQDGEILKMARMCRPRVRVVLNVGHCHMEHFGSLEEVARAKGELFMEAEPGDICVLNADDPLVMSIPVPVGVKKVLFGRQMGCDVRLILAECVSGGRAVRVLMESQMPAYGNQLTLPGVKSETSLQIRTLSIMFNSSRLFLTLRVEFKIHGPGLHLATNACAAAAVAISLGVPLPQIGKSLARFKPVPMRSQIEVSQNGITIINDTYNASLTSMIAAIKSLASMDCIGKRVVILGDMLELGESETMAHEMVLELCCVARIGMIILVGDRFIPAARSLNIVGRPKIMCVCDATSLVVQVSEFVAGGDVVLVKGSRRMKMEMVVEAIKMINM